jgi:hypothetical protein
VTGDCDKDADVSNDDAMTDGPTIDTCPVAGLPLGQTLLQHDRLVSLAVKSTTASPTGGGSVMTGVADVAAGDNEDINDENDDEVDNGEVDDDESDCGSENDGSNAVDGGGGVTGGGASKIADEIDDDAMTD